MVRLSVLEPPDGLRAVEIPLELPPVVIGMAWHPRNDADQGHRWPRERIRSSVLTLLPTVD